jgi:hypothetical protein
MHTTRVCTMGVYIIMFYMPRLSDRGVKISAAARAILREDGKAPSWDLGPPVHSWGSWSGTKQLDGISP